MCIINNDFVAETDTVPFFLQKTKKEFTALSPNKP